MAVDFKERVLEFIEDHRVVRRSLLWGLPILLLLFFSYGPYRFTFVNGPTMRPEIKRSEYYYLPKAETICLGDLVELEHPENGGRAIRSVMAFSGSILRLTDTGFSIDGNSVEMSEAWVAAARKIVGESDEMSVPEGQVLVRRTAPDNAESDQYEAFLVVPHESVSHVMSRVILALNPTRIGHSLRSDSTVCIDLGASGS